MLYFADLGKMDDVEVREVREMHCHFNLDFGGQIAQGSHCAMVIRKRSSCFGVWSEEVGAAKL